MAKPKQTTTRARQPAKTGEAAQRKRKGAAGEDGAKKRARKVEAGNDEAPETNDAHAVDVDNDASHANEGVADADPAEDHGAEMNGHQHTDEEVVATPTKSKPKKTKSTKQPAKSKPAAAPKKRKTRTLEDKQRENAPMNKAFYVETGEDWHATNVDFDELTELRAMWQLPAAAHVLWLLQQPLTLRACNTLLEYEAALLSPESSTLLEDVFTKLLLKKSERDCLAPGIGLKYEWWNKQLREYYLALYDKWYALLRKAGDKVPVTVSFLESSESEEDLSDSERDVELSDDEWLALDILKSRLEGLGAECPLQHQSFGELTVQQRCKILLNLCEAVVDDPANTDYIRQMEEDDLRNEPVGRDRAGNWFYFFPQFYQERRMYRVDVKTQEWTLWAKGDDAFRQMLTAMRAIRGRKLGGEQELIDHLEAIVEQIEEEAEVRAKQLEKATRKAILEAIPRKRSLRIQVKQIEQLEKQQEEVEAKKVMSQEEIAEMKRAEFLRKVEQDAERESREREREARRQAQEEQEREAAQAEREMRRLRRLEKEQHEEVLQQKLEEERKRQEEARKLRAMQRQGDELEFED
ncbi:hypothetical protein Poli38472_009015 [Pythium oligandrum]|uniref:WHIM1 domain-containing protein n=1 Tax=Pythium oligandrum TaxID=41045 RepID=A0A8K1CKW9_PYTOL|nr:hypothetical protein Poli38472_009015 [Pythium oligandrum]|eukprot:TMW64848.1 hypothetical protein Poli38472_009015 [Pythium oligandrum]